ncbi:MAG: ATP-binding cassette domain-containing protein [Clostridia bacterium]|nr:ATP-binding cassette domain-containing protein [Erysipelotrichia bacterium]NCC87580.1 ATP-binding cassette domain-containing protein [Clostridia bacterium]
MNDKFINGIRIHWDRLQKDHYVKQIKALANLEYLSFHRNITFFVGENGSGKSTLLEAIAVASGLNAEGGTRNFNFATSETHSQLCDAITTIKGVHRPVHSFFLRAESFYNVATQYETYRDSSKEHFYQRFGGKSLHEQSHGESFLHLIQGSFNEDGLYFLDEPEAALSPQRQLTLLIHLHQLASTGAQFIIATHSPILLGVPNCEILSFDHGEIIPIAYEECESYQVMKMFINEREKMLKHMLE